MKRGELMKPYNTSKRLKQLMSDRDIKQVDILNMCKPICNMYGIKLGKNDLSQYVNGKVEPGQEKLYVLAEALKVSEAWLMGYDVPMSDEKNNLKQPEITEETVTFPVIGEIAAGYDSIAIEDWSGETVEIPVSYLKGRNKDEFFVLSVKGDSMYPLYMDGDKVLILRQTTLNRSGEIGAVLYDGDYATLKKVEYVTGENWMKLIPINPSYQPKLIENEDLNYCRIMGIPKLLIREIEN